MTMQTFDDARAAVAAGESVDDVARSLVAALTREERLWCLDGDAPTWAGLTFLGGDDGYHKAPFVAAEVERVGLPGIRFSDGPRGAVVGNATCFPVTMARGATWDPELEERIGDAIGARAAGGRREPHRRGVRQRAAPPGVGSGAGDLRRGPAPRRRARRGADPRPAAPRDGVREALRVQLDGERPVHRRHRGRRGRAPRGVPPALPPDRRRGRRVGDVGVQQRQRRVVRAEPRAPHRRAARRVGLRGLRHQRLDLRAARRRDVGDRRARHRDAVPDGRAAAPARRARERRGVVGRRRPLASSGSSRTLLRFDDVLSAPDPPAERPRFARAPRAGPRGRGPLGRPAAQRARRRRARSCRSRPTVGTGRGARPARRHGQPRRRRVERRVGPRVPHGARRPARRGRRRGPRRRHRPRARRARSRPAPTSRSWSSATRTSTRASTSATTDPSLADALPERRRARGRRAVRRVARPTLPPTTKPERLSRPRDRASASAATAARCGCCPTDVELIRAVAAANPRTVVAIQAGSAVVATEWIDAVPAVVQAWYGGCQAGPGLADVLLGAVNPSARLPFTRAGRRSRPPAVRPRRHALRLRPLARLVAPRPQRHRRRRSRSASACRTRRSRSATSRSRRRTAT